MIESRSGYHFDPGVVNAVAEVLESEQLGVYGDSAFEPHLHHMPLPRLVAKVRAPSAGLA